MLHRSVPDVVRRSAREVALPLVAAVVVLGPALGPGALFNLDLVVVPRLDVPSGFWGLGPELPRRTPFWVPIAALSHLVPATLIVKAVLVAVFVGAWLGMARFTRLVGGRWAHSAAALYAFSPFVLTRTAVGHLMVTVPLAILPWALPHLLRPGRRLRSTYLAAFALGCAGHFGGSLALAVVAVALVVGERARWWQALGLTLVAQGTWLVPSLFLWPDGGARISSADVFATDLNGWAGALVLSAGGGFWNTYYQVQGPLLITTVAGLVLLGFAVVGSRQIEPSLRRPLLVVGVIGWFVPALTAATWLPAADAVTSVATLGGIWRESQRVLVLHLVWLAPAAVIGAERLARAAERSRGLAWLGGTASVTVPAVAVVLASPGLWGIGGQLAAVPLPTGWEETRDTVRAEPGTVLALPWNQYYNQTYDDGRVRRVLDPMPLFLGGDVLASSDNGLQNGVQEVADPREPFAERAVELLTEADPGFGDELVDLGVRWVVLHKSIDPERYAPLADDPALELVIDEPTIGLYRVRGWAGEFVTSAGSAVDATTLGDVVARLDGPEYESVTWQRAGGPGWMIGWRRATTTDHGLLRLPSGSGLVWNLATVPSVLAVIACSAAALLAATNSRMRLRKRSPRC